MVKPVAGEIVAIPFPRTDSAKRSIDLSDSISFL